MTQKRQTAVVKQEVTYELAVTNQEVVKAASLLKWKPETIVRRVKKALPTIIHQQVYLALAADFRIHPESLAKLIDYYLGENGLKVEDLEPRSVGSNLVTSKFSLFTEFLSECFSLLRLVAEDYTELGMSLMNVAEIVQHYGTFEPQRVIELADHHLDEFCEYFGISEAHSYSERMRLCVWLFATKIIPENRRRGLPDIVDMSDVQALIFDSRHNDYRLFAGEYTDGISDSHSGIDQALRWLRGDSNE